MSHKNIIIFLAFIFIIAGYVDDRSIMRKDIRTLKRSHALLENRLEEIKNNPCVFCHMDNEGNKNVPEGWGRHDGGDK